MSFPKLSNGRVDPQLTNVLLAFRNQSFLAEQILPTIPGLKEESGVIPKMGNAHLRHYSTKRSLWDEGDHRINFTISNDDTYQVDYFDLSSYVPDRLQRQLQSPFNAKNAAQMTVMNALMLEREKGLATILTNTSVLTNNTTLSGTSQYTDTVNSTPEVDFDTARDSIQESTGFEANSVVMTRKVANALRRHPFFLEIAQSVMKGSVSKGSALSVDGLVSTLKAWYGLEKVLISSQINVTSKEGQTETLGNVWNNDIVWFYSPKGPSLFEPSFGYSFQLAGQNRRASVRRHTNDKGDLVEVEWAYQDKILMPESAYLIKDAV